MKRVALFGVAIAAVLVCGTLSAVTPMGFYGVQAPPRWEKGHFQAHFVYTGGSKTTGGGEAVFIL